MNHETIRQQLFVFRSVNMVWFKCQTISGIPAGGTDGLHSKLHMSGKGKKKKRKGRQQACIPPPSLAGRLLQTHIAFLLGTDSQGQVWWETAELRSSQNPTVEQLSLKQKQKKTCVYVCVCLNDLKRTKETTNGEKVPSFPPSLPLPRENLAFGFVSAVVDGSP